MQKKQRCMNDVQSTVFMTLISVKLVEQFYWKLVSLIMMWLLRNSFDGKWDEKEVKTSMRVFFDVFFFFGVLFLAGVREQLGKISGREMELCDLGINNWVSPVRPRGWGWRVGVKGCEQKASPFLLFLFLLFSSRVTFEAVFISLENYQ